MMKVVIKFVSVLALFLTLALAQPYGSYAGVNIDINISPPPFFPIPVPPAVVLIPGAGVYFVPDIDMDIFFYEGYWYRPHRDEWFRSRDYNGPWAYVVPKRLPPPLLRVPPGFRNPSYKHERIPYRDFERHWKGRDRERHWDKDRGEGRGKDRSDDRGRDRGEGRGKDRGEHKGRGKHD